MAEPNARSAKQLPEIDKVFPFATAATLHASVDGSIKPSIHVFYSLQFQALRAF